MVCTTMFSISGLYSNKKKLCSQTNCAETKLGKQIARQRGEHTLDRSAAPLDPLLLHYSSPLESKLLNFQCDPDQRNSMTSNKGHSCHSIHSISCLQPPHFLYPTHWTICSIWSGDNNRQWDSFTTTTTFVGVKQVDGRRLFFGLSPYTSRRMWLCIGFHQKE